MRLLFIILSIMFIALGWPQLGNAHDEPTGSASLSEREEIERLVELYHYAIQFGPEILDQRTTPQSIPFLQVSGQKVYLNSHFWQMVGSWIAVYHAEVKKDCPRCLLPDPEEILDHAQEQPAQGLLRRILIDPLAKSGQHLTLEAVDLGARLGKVAFALKVTSEVAETALSKLMGGAGVHVLCTAIDAAILFGTRYIQTTLRVPHFAGETGISRLKASARVAYFGRVFRRARRRVRIEVGPISKDSDLLKAIDQEGPNRWWGFIQGGKRQAFLEKLRSQHEQNQKRLEEFEEQIASLPDSRKKRRLILKRNRLIKGFYPVARIHQKVYLGKRYKKFLWLKARRRGFSQNLKGTTWMDRVTDDATLWVLSVQENILNRALLGPEAQAPNLHHLRDFENSTPNYDRDEIRHYLAEQMTQRLSGLEGQGPSDSLAIDRLLQDIEFIFDPNQSRKERYLYVLMLESGINSFVYEWMRTLTKSKFETWPKTRENLQLQIKTRWHLGQLSHVMSEFADFLRVAATTPEPDILQKRKYESMDFFTEILQAFFSAGRILDVSTPSELSPHINEIKASVRSLRATRPWREKKLSFPKPFSWRAPLCSKLHRRAQ